ncbi:hypothetical protein ES703_85890 [subsurface metagenome]
MEPSFAAVEGHYKDTKLGEDIDRYKQVMGTYLSVGFKLRQVIMAEVYPLSSRGAKEATVFLEGLRELLRTELAPVRVRLYSEGVETDLSAVLEKLPDQGGKPFQQFIDFVSRYRSKAKGEPKNDIQEAREEGKAILELIDKLVKNYEIMRRLEKTILRRVEKEKLKGMLPPGTKCEFCVVVPTTR